MTISDEKLDELLNSFKVAMTEMTRINKENDSLHKEMIHLLKENMNLKQNGQESPHRPNLNPDYHRPSCSQFYQDYENRDDGNG